MSWTRQAPRASSLAASFATAAAAMRAAALKARESISQTVKEDLLSPGHKRSASTYRPAPDGGYVKRKRCGECAGCNAGDCGKCDNCRDMPRFGGKGTKRQACRNRYCHVIKEEDDKAREEQNKDREVRQAEKQAEREATHAQREALRAEREALRAARRVHKGPRVGGASGSRKAGREARELQALVGRASTARLAAIRLEGDVSEGWGQHTLPTGTLVEAKEFDPELQDAIYEGRVLGKRRTYLEDEDEDYDDEQATHASKVPPDGGVQMEVEFDELLPDGEDDAAAAGGDAPLERLHEWLGPSALRRRPPSGGFPPGVLELVRVGDVIELRFDDGWWAVEVKDIAPSGSVHTLDVALARGKERGVKGRKRRRTEETDSEDNDDEAAATDGGARPSAVDEKRFTVMATKYNKMHRVGAAALRPHWLWAAEANTWRFELLAGHGCVPVDGAGGRPTFTFANGALRARTQGLA